MLFAAKIAQAQQMLGCRRSDASFALDAFDKNRGGRRRNGLAHGRNVVEGNLPKTGRHRLEAFLDLLLAGRGNASQGPSVERMGGRNNLEAALVMTKLASQLEQTFIGFVAAVAEKNFAGANLFNQRLRETALRLVVIKIPVW